MDRKKVWGVVACALLITTSSAHGILNLALRVGCAYVGYKFVDGVADSAISNFVDQYTDGVVNGICSFGKGVEQFGAGCRKVAVQFWHDDSDAAFSTAWKGVTDQFGSAVVAMQSEWEVRSSAKKTKKVVCSGERLELEEVQKDSSATLAKGKLKTSNVAS